MVYFYDFSFENLKLKIYMGKDKFENEELIKNGLNCDVWFHVDNLSSAHVCFLIFMFFIDVVVVKTITI